MARQGGVVASMTMLSRIMGFLRDMLVSYFFGAGQVADAFFVAFRVPNFFRRVFAEGAFSQAFVPVLARYKALGPESLREFTSLMFGNLAVVVLVVVVLGALFAEGLTAVFAPGFIGTERFELTADMVRITFPYLAFISLTSFAGALLNVHHRFAVPAFTPVLLNFCLIGAMLFGTQLAEQPVMALAWGVLIAGVVQLGFQIPSLLRARLMVSPRVGIRHEGVRRVGTLLLPAIFVASVHQLNALIDTVLASLLIEGSISWLYYADRLMELPVGLVAVALGTVLLPNLSRLDDAGDRDGFAATLDWGVRTGLVLAVPAAFALYGLALPLVATIFFHGALDDGDVRMAALALQAFSVGVVPLVMVKILAPAYFARQDTRSPFRIGVVAVIVNITVNLSIFWWFGHVGLALGTAISGLVNAYLLLRGILSSGRYQPSRLCYLTLIRVVSASVLMLLVLMYMLPEDSAWLSATTSQRLVWLLQSLGAGGCTYLIVLLVSGMRPRQLLHRA